MAKLYDLNGLRPLSLFAPDIRVQQVTVESTPEQIAHISRANGRRAEVVFVLRRESGDILLINRAVYPTGTYRLPTGGVEPGESPKRAAIREIEEETGYQISDPGLLGVVDYLIYWPGTDLSPTSFVSYIFLADVAGDQSPKAVDGEIDDYRWVPATALSNIAIQMRNLPPEWVYWGRFRAVSYDFIQCGIMQYNRDVGIGFIAGR
jgi:8-oxo-dGTP diphosphatase